MRVKKQKRNRKSVRFYAACFGFREPYKVLCDGTFVHHLVDQKLTPADDAVAKTLGGKCLLFSTSCVHGELGALGGEYVAALRAARELVTARCAHEKRVHAISCIQDVVADGNPEHFFVATQDAELREKLRQLPGVPVLYALKNSLFVEKPSFGERQFVKGTEEKRLHMSELEAKLLGKRKTRDASPQAATEEDADEGAGLGVDPFKKRKLAKSNTGDKWQFKRKMAKGPNPLSCKKKKAKETSTSIETSGTKGNAEKRKRSRKRNKSKDGKATDTAGAGNQ